MSPVTYRMLLNERRADRRLHGYFSVGLHYWNMHLGYVYDHIQLAVAHKVMVIRAIVTRISEKCNDIATVILLVASLTKGKLLTKLHL